jgi:hypothetical protein
MRDLFIDALKRKYEAEIAAGKATAKVYFEKPVAIGEHPQFLDELDKVLTNIANAEENLKTLDKYFNNSIDDDDIPF